MSRTRRRQVSRPAQSVVPRRASRLSVIAAVCAALAALAACSSGSPQASGSTTPGPGGSTSSTPTPSTSTSAAPRTTAKPIPTSPVHVSLFNEDGSTYGVGMPLIAYFSKAPTNAHAFAAATKVTVNGQPIAGNWYFEPTSYQYTSGPYSGKFAQLEGHWRPQNYWPAHARVHMSLPVKGLTAGTGLAYDDSLTSDWSTGAANISTIDASTERMTVMSDGRQVGVYPVSLGAPDTPTKRGIKVIMEKGASICMSGPGYNECGVKWTQRLTYDGEYLHSAPWNVRNIGSRSTSNGCTNLLPADAQKLYGFFIQGDVFAYPNADGPQMRLGDGFGDWNVAWAQWQTGGDLKV